VFDDERWPKPLRDDLATALEEGYHRAEEMLKPQSYPDEFPRLKKLEALENSANYLRSNLLSTTHRRHVQGPPESRRRRAESVQAVRRLCERL